MKIKYGVQIFLHTTLASRRFNPGPRSSNGKFRVKNTTKNGLLNVNIYETNSLNTDMKTSLASCPASERYITSTRKGIISWRVDINTLNPELNPICYLLALLGAHHFLHVSRTRVKSLTLRQLMSYI